VREVLREWGYPADDPAVALRAFLGDAVEVFKARQAGEVIVVEPEFEALQKSQVLTRRVEMWSQALVESAAVAGGGDPMEVLLFGPRTFLDLHSAIRVLDV
jgi:hypothetical protein